MPDEEEKKLLASGSLGTSVNLAPFDELTVQSSWEEVPKRIWVTNPTSLSPTLNVGLPRDSHHRQVVLKILDTALSTTETGVDSIDDFISLLPLLGYQIEPSVSSVLTIAGLGTRAIQSVKVRGVVGREKLVIMSCPNCNHVEDFGEWDNDEAQKRVESCPECGFELDGKNTVVI